MWCGCVGIGGAIAYLLMMGTFPYLNFKYTFSHKTTILFSRVLSITSSDADLSHISYDWLLMLLCNSSQLSPIENYSDVHPPAECDIRNQNKRHQRSECKATNLISNCSWELRLLSWLATLSGGSSERLLPGECMQELIS